MTVEITALLKAAGEGSEEASEELFAQVYATLRRIAGARMRYERPNHTLTPTALVHEAYLKMSAGEQAHWRNRAQFFALGARAMRQILIDHALKRQALKRGGDQVQVTLDGVASLEHTSTLDLLALDEALTRLAEDNPRRAQVVTYRFFGGLDVRETAAVMELSPATVKRDWVAARAWLNRELTASEGSSSKADSRDGGPPGGGASEEGSGR